MTPDVEFLPIVHPLYPYVGTLPNTQETLGELAHIDTVICGIVLSAVLIVVVHIDHHEFGVVVPERNELGYVALIFVIEVPFCIQFYFLAIQTSIVQQLDESAHLAADQYF